MSLFASSVIAVDLRRVHQPCPPSNVLLARIQNRHAHPAEAVAAPSNREPVATASALVLQVLEVLKAKKGVCTTPEIFNKCSSMGLLDTQKQLIEFREALQAVAHCSDSVWTLKPEWLAFKMPPKAASKDKRRR